MLYIKDPSPTQFPHECNSNVAFILYSQWCKIDVSTRLQRPRILYLMYNVVTNLEISHTYGSFIFSLFLMAGGTLNFCSYKQTL